MDLKKIRFGQQRGRDVGQSHNQCFQFDVAALEACETQNVIVVGSGDLLSQMLPHDFDEASHIDHSVTKTGQCVPQWMRPPILIGLNFHDMGVHPLFPIFPMPVRNVGGICVLLVQELQQESKDPKESMVFIRR